MLEWYGELVDNAIIAIGFGFNFVLSAGTIETA
jgi:hypothetical protein